MYNPNQPLNVVQTLQGLAVAADNAQNHKFADQTQPFVTTEGSWPRAHFQPYQSGMVPAAIAYAGGNRVVAAVAGIQGQRDALSVYRGWLSLEAMPGYAGLVNGYAKTWCDTSFPWVEAIDTQTRTDFTFVGHSWGACVATWAAIRTKRRRPSVRVRLVTFGAPRFANAAFLNQLQGIEFIRVYATNDPFPFLVPWFSEAPLLHALHDAFAVMAMNQMTHMGNGVFIKKGQRPVNRDRPTENLLAGGFNVPLMRNLMASGVEPHWTSTYVDILDSLVNDVDPRLHNAESQPNAERAVPGPQVSMPEAEAIAAWPDKPWPAAARPPAEPLALAPQLVPLPDPVPGGDAARKVRIKRQAGKWCVYVGEHLEYRGTSKRDARGVARAIRAIGEQYSQNPAGFTDAGLLVEGAAGLQPW